MMNIAAISRFYRQTRKCTQTSAHQCMVHTSGCNRHRNWEPFFRRSAIAQQKNTRAIPYDLDCTIAQGFYCIFQRSRRSKAAIKFLHSQAARVRMLPLP